jgi:hypothetical protein
VRRETGLLESPILHYTIAIPQHMTVYDKLCLRGGRPEHLFLKVLPKQGLGCEVIGTSIGAVDPEINRKWVWAFVEVIFKLVDGVMSIFD